MQVIFRDALVYMDGTVEKQTMFFDGSSIFPISSFDGNDTAFADATVIDNIAIFPGFCDVHVHFREPGFSYKETVAGGSLAAAAGGYTAVMTMPNLRPAPDSVENLTVQLDIIKRDAKIPTLPYATITVGEEGNELSDIDALSKYVLAFSDDGRGVQSESMMLSAMKKVRENGKMIAAHCEDNSLLNGGYIHDGEYARLNGHRGIPSESEYRQIERDIELVKKTGCKYHVCHVSTKEGVDIIRRAKAEGLNVSFETAPHYLIMDDSELLNDGRFKMNPPIRAKADKDALVRAMLDGTLDMIATDHAPHSSEEKSRGLEKSVMGVVGLETAFALMYTYFVKTGVMSLQRLIELMSVNPRRRFKIDTDAGFTVFDLNEAYVVNPDVFHGKGRATPFEGKTLYGKCLLTVVNGKIAYDDLNSRRK
jgi:dihydroorotase